MPYNYAHNATRGDDQIAPAVESRLESVIARMERMVVDDFHGRRPLAPRARKYLVHAVINLKTAMAHRRRR
jgi:hypothetical protein